MNETIRKFGHPATLIHDYVHWVVLLRPAQPTLGSLVLAAKSEATTFSDIDPAAFSELAKVTRDIETALSHAVSYDRINYLMLMMVDPNVHFHVIPRYKGNRSQGAIAISDVGWPKPPALGEAKALSEGDIGELVKWLKGFWA